MERKLRPGLLMSSHKLVAAACFLLIACHHFETPTAPGAACTIPAALTISVMPLHDPEPFAMVIDNAYDTKAVASTLQQMNGVTKVQTYSNIHEVAADIRTDTIPSVRCVAGVLQLSQGRSGTPPP